MFPAGFPILKLLYFIWRCFALTSAFYAKAAELSFGWKNAECVVFVGLPALQENTVKIKTTKTYCALSESSERL